MTEGPVVRSDIALVLRHPDYRGDHATDVASVVRVPLSATVMDLLEIVKRRCGYGKAWLEVKPEEVP